jgi:hypothetical protein
LSNITNLNRDYLIKINVKEATIDVPKMTFWNTDKKTSNMFVQLVINMSENELIKNYVTIENATDYKIVLNVIKPKTNQYRTFEAKLLNEEKALFEIDLTSEFTDQVGNYNFEFEVSSKVDNNDESITTSSSTYEVKGSILTNLNKEISSSPDLPILKQLIEQVKSLQGGDLTGYQKKSDNSLETTSKEIVGAINEVNSQYKDIENEKNILTSPDGVKWKIVVDNDGKLTAKLYDNGGKLLLTFSNLTYQDRQLTLVYVVTERDSTNGYIPKKWLYTMPTDNGWCFMLSTNTYNNPVYLCDWDKSKCETSYQDPQYYTHCLTKEGDIISVFRSYAICGEGTNVIEGIRKNPIIYHHDDYLAKLINFDITSEVKITGDDIGLTQLSNFGVETTGEIKYYGTNNIKTFVFPIEYLDEITINAINNNRFIISSSDVLISNDSKDNYTGTLIYNSANSREYTFSSDKKYIYAYLANASNTKTLSFDVTIKHYEKEDITSNLIQMSNYSVDKPGEIIYHATGNIYSYLLPVSYNDTIIINSTNNNRFRIVGLNESFSNESTQNYSGTNICYELSSTNISNYIYENKNENIKYLFIYLSNNVAPTLQIQKKSNNFTNKTSSYIDSEIITSNEKPNAWLQNCGVEVFDDYILFGEYTRPAIGLNCHVWKVTSPYTNLSNWTKVKSMEISRMYNGDLKHIHTINYDVYGNVIYMATGDHNQGASIYYSKNAGVTWTQLGYGELQCRLLNMIFTKDYIYWASDSGLSDKHGIFRVGRLDNGIMDFSSLEKLCDYPYVSSQQATYSTVYLKEKNMLLFLDRFDNTGNSMNIYYYDITNNKFDILKTITSVNNANVNLGFRCSAVNWYATSTNEIICGFGIGENPCYIDVSNNTSNYNLKNLVLKIR